MSAEHESPAGDSGNAGAPGPGTLIADRYRVDRTLGIGGMGIVVAAQHVQLGHPVAIKFLLPDALSQAGAVERFLREARAAIRIQSEHVVRMMDVGTLASGSPYVARAGPAPDPAASGRIPDSSGGPDSSGARARVISGRWSWHAACSAAQAWPACFTKP